MARIFILLTLFGAAFGNPDTHVYPKDCKPPVGFESNETEVTTVDYVTMRPIERCCPQCEQCKDIGGYCALKWVVDLYPQGCDFAPVEECRDYSCKCCIKCVNDKCSPCVETGGECRAECRSGELEDTINVCSYYNNGTGCKCCKKCKASSECTDAYGICTTDPAYCPIGSVASTGCCGGCYCCKPVLVPNPPIHGGSQGGSQGGSLQGGGCDADGAYCSEYSDCAIGFYPCFGGCIKTEFTAGLQSTESGYCCLPKQTGSPGGGKRIKALPFFLNQQHDILKHPRQLFD